MWNPDIYHDTDFGLARDESFEPEELGGDDHLPGPGDSYIQTVLGRIDPDDAGLTLMKEHLHREIRGEGQDEQLTSVDAALLDLEAFFTVGGRTVVDATVSAAGRSIEVLLWLAQRAPVHIVASTGFSLSQGSDVAEMRDTIEQDLAGGLDGASARPGLLLLNIGDGNVPPQARSVFEMIADVTSATPLPVLITMPHEEPGAELIAKTIGSGIDADRLIAVAPRGVGDVAALRSVLELGSYLLIDGIGWNPAGTDRATAGIVAQLMREGYQERLLLSHGFARRSQLTGYEGKPGFGYIVEQFAIMLLEAGVEAHHVRTLLLDNCSAALSIRPRSQVSAM